MSVTPFSTLPSSSENAAASASRPAILPNTAPPTKAAMKPLPPRASAMPNAPTAAITGTTGIHRASIQPRDRAACNTQPATTPATTPPTIPQPIASHDQPRRVGRRGVAGIGLRDGKRDREQRHAQAVVEAALDVQALTYTRRQVLVGDDRLAQRGVGRSQHDREHERLGPRDRAQHESAHQRPDDDRERQADAQQTGGYRVLACATHANRSAKHR